MGFLADDNFPYPSVRFLRAAGLDVYSIQESAASVADTEVMALAGQLNRTILTFDRDYGELIYRFNHRPPAVSSTSDGRPTTPKTRAGLFSICCKPRT
ncbi:hypothetical protein D0N36_07450 [Hymenobacter lapidiphilus]|uniref:DUF5615 family PIN-like protein n=1 Tax=Hymenobacter sp. CCM 8763 TaxID=2303334 RepID=UPI000E351DDB|nr:hypothetical protein D0N36_07450 [Hymenobacter sp. CCM 8763]